MSSTQARNSVGDNPATSHPVTSFNRQRCSMAKYTFPLEKRTLPAEECHFSPWVRNRCQTSFHHYLPISLYKYPRHDRSVDAVTYCEQTCMPKREILNESPFLSIIIRNEYFPLSKSASTSSGYLWPSITFYTFSLLNRKETIKRPVV